MESKDRMKLLRKERKMTQRELATKLNMSTSTIAMYEAGTRTPSVEVLIKMREVFHTSIDYILGF